MRRAYEKHGAPTLSFVTEGCGRSRKEHRRRRAVHGGNEHSVSTDAGQRSSQEAGKVADGRLINNGVSFAI